MDPKFWEEMKADPKEEDIFLRPNCVCFLQPCQDLLPGFCSQEGHGPPCPCSHSRLYSKHRPTRASPTHPAMSPGYLKFNEPFEDKQRKRGMLQNGLLLGNLLLTPLKTSCHDFYSERGLSQRNV